jgi:endonuclease YncB( thermonuclease family)
MRDYLRAMDLLPLPDEIVALYNDGTEGHGNLVYQNTQQAQGWVYAVRQTSHQPASALVFGLYVILQTHGKDNYGRTLADVLLSDGTNVNHQLVQDGWCWWYRKYAPGDTVLEGLEREARETKKGLWVDPAPIPPWVYRKTKGG